MQVALFRRALLIVQLAIVEEEERRSFLERPFWRAKYYLELL